MIDDRYYNYIKKRCLKMVMGRSDQKKIPRHLCECGCGQEVKKCRSRFIQGHYSKYKYKK